MVLIACLSGITMSNVHPMLLAPEPSPDPYTKHTGHLCHCWEGERARSLEKCLWLIQDQLTGSKGIPHITLHSAVRAQAGLGICLTES